MLYTKFGLYKELTVPIGAPLHVIEDRGNADVGLRIALLGGFRVWVHGMEIPGNAWRLQKARGIIKLLALTPDHSLHRAEIVEHLWPEFDPVAATNNLHRTLHASRRALKSVKQPGLPSPTLKLHGQLVSLEPAGSLWIDVDAFSNAAREARTHRNERHFVAALELYGGELLPEDRYENWTLTAREALHRERLHLLSELAEIYRAKNDITAAAEIRSQVVRDDPYDEEAQLALMRDLAVTGQRGKALAQFQQLRDALKEIDEVPGPESERLYREILARRYSTTCEHDTDRAQPNTNLPIPLTSFVGRDAERAALVELLRPARDDPRLVTLTGPGGSGKTRLALTVAQDLVADFPGGVWFVDLARITDETALPSTLASTLNIGEVPARSVVDVIVEELGSQPVLLLWDNCEHLVDACARLARQILLRAGDVRILATSRQPFGVHGEAVRRVQPLPLPAANGPIDTRMVDALAQNDCIRLFSERARLVRSDFRLAVSNVAAVAQICRRLDGMPLPLELAAARMGTMSSATLAERLDRSLQVLGSAGKSLEPRQRTLRGMLDWSYNLLSSSERALFRRLAVFVGGWTLDMAERVCADRTLPAYDVLGLLADLVDKSLVQFESVDGEGRYRFLEVVRQYAAERLDESGETQSVRARHAEVCTDLAETAEAKLRGPLQTAWLDRLERDYGNIQSAIQWLAQSDELVPALRLSSAIWWFCFLRGHYAEERERLIRLLEQIDAVGIELHLATRANALLAAGALAWKREELPLSRRLLEESVAIRRELDDPSQFGWALIFLGHVAGSQGEFFLGNRYAREALELFRACGDRSGMARALNAIGEDARRLGHDDEAEAFYRESLELDRQEGNRAGMALRLHNLGYIALHRSCVTDAGELFFECLQLAQDLKDLDLVAACLEGVAAIEAVTGESRRSMWLFGAADALRAELNVPIDIADKPEHDRYFALAESGMTAVDIEREWRRGRQFTLDQALNALTETVARLSSNVQPQPTRVAEHT